jgi:hypothetical protein
MLKTEALPPFTDPVLQAYRPLDENATAKARAFEQGEKVPCPLFGL